MNPITPACVLFYTPKGSMCANCVNCLSDCSHLDFRSMKVFKDYGDIVIVVCSEYKAKAN